MRAEGEGRLLVNVASLWPAVDASGAQMDQTAMQMDQTAMMRYLNEMIWFPAAFLAGNISFEAVDDSSARATLTDFVAQRYRPPMPEARKRGRPQSPATASSRGSGFQFAARRSTSSPAATLSTSR
jgi:hypothetical protein